MPTLIKRRTLFVASTVVLGIFLSGVCMAQEPHQVFGQQQKEPHHFDRLQQFVGLWEAVDISDGSTQHLSITCTSDKSCDVRLNDTAFTYSCDNQIGVAYGEGSIRRNVLTVDLSLYCSNLDGTSTFAGTQVNKFVFDRRNGTLKNLNDDDIPKPNVFHKISQ